MYFNEKHGRTGNLFIKPFRSKHIHSDSYLRRVAQYIHLNPIELFEPSWKEGKVKKMHTLERNLLAYPFSSLPDYFDVRRFERNILDNGAVDLIRDNLPTLGATLSEVRAYYEETEKEF